MRGIRREPDRKGLYADSAHRIPVEVEKSDKEKGHFIHPELFGHAGELSIGEVNHPALKVKQ